MDHDMKTVEQLLNEARSLLPYRYSPEEIVDEINAGTLVIDIRGDEQQRQDGLIPRTMIIRRNVLEWRCDPASSWHHELITDHGQKIIVFCNEGYQSSLAAANLQRLGLANATDMVGGFSRWKESGLPTTPYDIHMIP
jgi:rhodanese-related sulfurtransferase